MTRPDRLPVAVLAVLSLAGCGQYLGDYTVESVRVTTDVPIPEETSSHYGRFLEVSLVSDTSLTAISDEIDGMYVDADFCPLHDVNGLIAFGPFSDEGIDLGFPSAAPPLRQGTDGRFRYRVYLPVSYQAQAVTQLGQLQLPTYDLRQADGPVCLRFFAPGYNLFKSRSETFEVPADIIGAALSSQPAAGGRR